MKKYKSNWILLVSIIAILLFSICLFFLIDSEEMKSSRMNYKVSFYVFSLFAILVAPITEEIVFRGFFTNKPILKKISIILLIPISLLVFYSNYNIYLFLLALLTILCNVYFYLKYKEHKKTEYLLVVTNALFFGFVHYKLSDFYSVNSTFFVLGQISFGFLLIWITKNFGIVKSIISHATINFVILIITFFGIQFVDVKIYRKESKNVIIQWNQVPFFKSNSGSNINEENKMIIKNLDLSNTIVLTGISDKKTTYFIKYPFVKYDITITSKNKKISDKEIIEALEMANLVSFE